jgi:ABC-type multidrug transport system ATPase subunit
VVSVNGRPLAGADMKRLMAKIAYVKQADIFFEHLTVRDQLGYTAMMRLPQVWTKQKKMDEVEQIIRLLRLTKVANSEIRMLSGGEKKRVNIGTELLTDPDVLLLDEPTSGLDSTSAVALVKMLQGLARTKNKTIITSIHQPSSAVFVSFDRLIMLAEGHVVYFGRPRDSMNYLRQQLLNCPDGYNAADHWMDLLVQDSAIEEEEENSGGHVDMNGSNTHADPKLPTPTTSASTVDSDGDFLSGNDGPIEIKENNNEKDEHNVVIKKSLQHPRPTSMTKRQQLIGAWDNEAVAEQMDFFVKQEHVNRLSLEMSSPDSKKNEQQASKYNTSWGLQYRVLVHRSLKNSRSAIFTTINIVKSCALGLVTGLLWFQMEYTEARVFDRSSYFFFTMTFWVFDAMFQSFMTFPTERTVVLKERASGSYQLSAYFMGKTTSEMPARLVLPMIYMIISFWMASIGTKFSMFLATTFISLLSVMAGEAIGLLVGATIYDTEKGMTFMTVISLFLALVGGFFVENVPSFLVWCKYLSPFKYSFDASLQLVFNVPVPCDGSGALETLCNGSDEGFASPEEVMAFLGVQGSMGFNVGILIAIGLVPRYLAYLALRSKKEGDR